MRICVQLAATHGIDDDSTDFRRIDPACGSAEIRLLEIHVTEPACLAQRSRPVAAAGFNIGPSGPGTQDGDPDLRAVLGELLRKRLAQGHDAVF